MSRKQSHANYSKEFAKIILPIAFGAIIFLSLMLWLSSCSRIRLDCTPHQEKKAQRLLSKSIVLCDKPFVDLAAKRFDNVTYVHDSVWQDKLVPIFDTTFVGDTVLVVKTDTKVQYRQVIKQVENKAKIEQLERENCRLNAVNTDLNISITKNEATYKEQKEILVRQKAHWIKYSIILSIFAALYLAMKLYLRK